MPKKTEDTPPAKPKRVLVNKLNDLTAKEWLPETISVFTQKGLGAGHKDARIEKLHPAPYSFQDVARLIRFFTKKGDTVFDPFVGVGSTLKAAAVESRKGVGIELVEKFYNLTQERLATELDDAKDQEVIHGDSLKVIKKLKDNSVDFLVTSPPYWTILNKKADHKAKERQANNLDTNYSELKEDLANIEKYEDFINVLSNFFIDCGRLLKPNKYMCIVVSDFRHKDQFYLFHSDLAQKIEASGDFKLKGMTVLYQRHKKIFPYGYPYSYVPNMHHQYIIILQSTKVADAKKK
jgi:DNA modification methylase